MFGAGSAFLVGQRAAGGRGGLAAIFGKFFAVVGKVFIVAGGLVTGLSFYGVQTLSLHFLIF